MHILYGVQGTGNGHISRASAMFEAFQKYPDINVTWLLSGREQSKGCGAIEEYLWRAGLTFVTADGKIQLLSTMLKNNLLQFRSDINSLDLSPYDLVISDYEPVICHAAKKRGVPVTGIGHQYAFQYKVPLAGSNVVVKTLMDKFAPVTKGVGMHWHHFGSPILPPIIDLEIPEPLPAAHSNKVLVYLPFENMNAVTALLNSFSAFEFYIYHPDASASDDGNMHLRPISRHGFKQDLLSSAMVISNCGFELISECLQTGKRILTKPLNGQMEQLSNGAALTELGYATVIHALRRELIEAWLHDSAAAPRVAYPNVSEALASWIASGQQESLESLSARLWDATIVHQSTKPAMTKVA